MIGGKCQPLAPSTKSPRIAGGSIYSPGLRAAPAPPARADARRRASYLLLLAFLFLLYANTPFLLPAAEILRPAKLVAGLALLALIGETMFGKRELRFAWPEGGLMIAFLGAAGLSCLTALWPGYAAQGVGDLAKMILTFFSSS